MEVEIETKIKPKFTAGDIETGEMVTVGAPEITYVSKETLTSMIEHYDGKVYSGDKTKLVVEDIKTNEI